MKYNKYKFESFNDLVEALKGISSSNLDFIPALPKDAEEYEFMLFSWKSDLQEFINNKWEKFSEPYITLSGSLSDNESSVDTFILMLGKLDSDLNKVVLGGYC